MKKVGKTRANRLFRFTKIKKERFIENPNQLCFFYKLPAIDNHHVIPRSERPDLTDDKRNIIPISRLAHDIMKNERRFMKVMPNWDKYLERMKSLDESYYNRFIHLTK